MTAKTWERVFIWFVLNLPFLLCHPGAPLLNDPFVRSLAINLVLFIVPGVPLTGLLLKRRGPSPLMILWVMAASALVSLGILLLTRIMGVMPDASRFWNCVWLATNALMLINWAMGAPSVRPLWPGRKSTFVAAALFALAYAAFFQGATRFVPPMEDHDYETQGTGFGLLTTFSPTLLTDRHTAYFFAHPPLLHFYVAGSFLYWNQLDRLALYDIAWQRQAADPDRKESELKLLYEQFRRDPALLPTRTPNLFLAALTVALLGAWVLQLTGRAWLGLLVGAAYASSPEVFVRSSYGGYFSAGQFAVLAILLAAADWRKKNNAAAWDCFLAGAFAALIDHKLLFLPLALGVWEGIRGARARWSLSSTLHPAALGFSLGTALFWLYGLAIDAGAFWLDHVHSHLIDRIVHHNPLGYAGYPGPVQLWFEFFRHTGALLLPLGVAASAAVLSVPSGSARQREETKCMVRPWAVWMFLLAFAFTVVDWRQTKHLTPLLLPLFLVPVLWSAVSKTGLRVVAGVLFVLTAWNVQAVWALCQRFAGFAITPAW